MENLVLKYRSSALLCHPDPAVAGEESLTDLVHII
jgi:hypothetical protein